MKKIIEIPALILVLIVLWLTESIWFHGQVLRKRWKMIPLFFVWGGGVGCLVIVLKTIFNS